MDHDHGNHCSNPHWKAVLSVVRDWFRIPVRAMNIVLGNDSRYWQWIRLKEEETLKIGFEEAAVLQQVNWLEVTGTIDMKAIRKAGTTQTYVIYYIVKFGADAFGWHSAPIKFWVRVNGEETEGRSLTLEPYRVKHDEWHEIPGGEFTVSTSSNTDGSVEFGMFEVDTDWWKGSMVLAGIKIKPKSS